MINTAMGKRMFIYLTSSKPKVTMPHKTISNPAMIYGEFFMTICFSD